MKALILLTALTLLVALPARSQTKVATYAFGQPNSVTYEQFSFWVKKGKRTAIYYTYGKNQKEVELQYLARIPSKTTPGFKVRFPNGHVFSLVPSEAALTVSEAGNPSRSFAWHYEGPVEGVGTFCHECAADGKEALQVLQDYYLK